MEWVMMRFALVLVLGALAGTAVAAPKPCEELKQEIEVKIQAAGVPSYTLEIVPNAEVKDQNMVVGTCENGTKKIIYQRNGN
ncbi:hypothetical protein PCA10_00410 [Metapseudomonas resinovorans NBRC 106553]|uniref:DUF1161 domain-containing protein n=2 Tax=Metapseudomonas resinovorans TaxID=53412 RepID=S6AKP5_METRE|nr:hypothetical protein PCA10_00410 [Pseudomonas resinovorans NBRC 106553]